MFFPFVVFFGVLSQSRLSWGINTECLICRMNMANTSPCVCGVVVVSFSRNNDPWSLEDWFFEEIQEASLNATHLWKKSNLMQMWLFCGISLKIVHRVVLVSYNDPQFSTFFQGSLVSCLHCEYSLGRCITETWLPSLREKKRVVLDFHGDFLPLGGESLNIQVSHEKNPGWLGYIGDYTTQLSRDYNKPL